MDNLYDEDNNAYREKDMTEEKKLYLEQKKRMGEINLPRNVKRDNYQVPRNGAPMSTPQTQPAQADLFGMSTPSSPPASQGQLFTQPTQGFAQQPAFGFQQQATAFTPFQQQTSTSNFQQQAFGKPQQTQTAYTTPSTGFGQQNSWTQPQQNAGAFDICDFTQVQKEQYMKQQQNTSSPKKGTADLPDFIDLDHLGKQKKVNYGKAVDMSKPR